MFYNFEIYLRSTTILYKKRKKFIKNKNIQKKIQSDIIDKINEIIVSPKHIYNKKEFLRKIGFLLQHIYEYRECVPELIRLTFIISDIYEYDEIDKKKLVAFFGNIQNQYLLIIQDVQFKVFNMEDI